MKIMYTDFAGNAFPLIVPVVARRFFRTSGTFRDHNVFGFRANVNPAFGSTYGLVIQVAHPDLAYTVSHFFWCGPVGDIFPKVDAMNGVTPYNGTIGGEFWNIYVRPRYNYSTLR